MFTSFTYRGVEYTVSGWLWGEDPGMIVRRDDGKPIRGVTMHPGMVQIGRSDSLDRHATRALERERDAREQEMVEAGEVWKGPRALASVRCRG